MSCGIEHRNVSFLKILESMQKHINALLTVVLLLGKD